MEVNWNHKTDKYECLVPLTKEELLLLKKHLRPSKETASVGTKIIKALNTLKEETGEDEET